MSPRSGQAACKSRRSFSGLRFAHSIRLRLQAFNSLDAQREACAAYIVSQRHEGWKLLPDVYDDGGYSGGNMERPGLKRLMAEVHAGRVDVIVVYKVDRLTRSLTDFSKIVDVLDGAGASFVSITQSFNTTSSMGRLTLNVLLSFAQFEREVISERVRDKVAASKAKGMWMGGPIPLGYDVVDRKLIPNEAEARVVRHIMQCYLDLGSVAALMDDLKASDIRTKRQISRTGRSHGGCHFAKGPLYHLLRNRLYRGQIVHHEKIYPGEHVAIVDENLFDAVQALLEKNAVAHHSGARSAHPSLLAGMVRDEHDRPMSPSHANKGSRRYRYYISNVSVPGSSEQHAPILRLPAADMERAIIDALIEMLDAAVPIRERWETIGVTGMGNALRRCSDLADQLPTMTASDNRTLLQTLDLQIMVVDRQIHATVSLERLLKRFGIDAAAVDPIERIVMPIATRVKTYGSEVRMVFPPSGAKRRKRDTALIALLVDAEAARQRLVDQVYSADDGQARRDLRKLARFAYLAPDIVSMILDGRQPEGLTRRRMIRWGTIPICWEEQRKALAQI